MSPGRQLFRSDESIAERGIGTEAGADERMRIVLNRLAATGAVALQHTPLVAKIEHRLDPARNVAGQKRDRPGWRNRGEKAVASPELGDLAAHAFRKLGHVRSGQETLGLVERK